MAHERLRPQFLFDEEKIRQLKQIAPECFEDGKINFETLRQNLGNWAQDEEDKELEHFGLFWPGKRDARRIASLPPQGTLEPVYGEGLKADGTPDTDGVNDSKNIFIEGENLEVLKILQKSYAGKIKMIYIDPPYNTGNDFVYDDDFTEPLQEYLRRTGQVDQEGKPQTTNKRSDGRFHSKWLSMMYPRLRLARNLLTPDGAIFINIDDNEIQNLKCILNEIFGEENFIGNIVWKHTEQSKNDERYLSRQYNYLLCYRKSDELEDFRFPRTEIDNKNYSNPDDDVNGAWRSGDVRSPNYRKTLCYDLETPSGKIIKPPENGWRWKKEVVQEKIKSGEIVFNEKETKIIRKIFLKNQEGRVAENLWEGEEFGTTRSANSEIKELFDGAVVFDTPKPTQLIKKIQQLFYRDSDYIVLDFFAGSGTTAHSVLQLNKEDGGNRTFVCIQLPARIDESDAAFKLGYRAISEVSKERIRRVIKRFNYSGGFKSVSLKSSNYKPWKNYEDGSIKELEKGLELFNQLPLVEGWSKDSLITEICLLEGFTLSSLIIKELEFKSNDLYKISDEYCEHSLLVCLDAKVNSETVNSLILTGSDIFICLDWAISIVDKLRLSDKGLIKTI